MIIIKPMISIEKSSIENMGFNGYKTNKIFVVDKRNDCLDISIEIKEHELREEYVKEWNQSKESMKYFEEVISQGYSLAAYENEKMIGFSIMSYYGWNNSMWIENIRVSEKYQGKGIGKELVEALKKQSQKKGARILGLETQSTNYPAIQFYKNCGFEISGVDFARYPQREKDLEQVAILMKFDLARGPQVNCGSVR